MQPIEEVVKYSGPRLRQMPGVLNVDVGGSESGPVIEVLVKEMTDRLQRVLPHEVGGYPVRAKVIGPTHES